jgi:hypothetical protein
LIIGLVRLIVQLLGLKEQMPQADETGELAADLLHPAKLSRPRTKLGLAELALPFYG